MFRVVLKRYSLLFLSVVIGYSLIHWLLVLKLNWVVLNQKTIDFWIPLIIGYALSLLFIRPLIKTVFSSQKIREALNLFVFPLSITAGILFTQNMVRVFHFGLIELDYPSQVYEHPKEKYFIIENFYIDRTQYFILQEEHTSGKRGRTLNLNDYYTLPFYKSQNAPHNNVVLGIKYHTSFNNGYFAGNLNTQKESFHTNNFNKFQQELLDNGFFILERNTDDEENFTECSQLNQHLDHTKPFFILSYNSTRFEDYVSEKKGMGIWGVLTAFAISNLIFFLCHYFVNLRKKKKIDD